MTLLSLMLRMSMVVGVRVLSLRGLLRLVVVMGQVMPMGGVRQAQVGLRKIRM